MCILLDVVPKIQGDGVVADEQLGGFGEVGVGFSVVAKKPVVCFGRPPNFLNLTERPGRAIANPHTYFIGKPQHLKNQRIPAVGQWRYAELVGNGVGDGRKLLDISCP